MTAVLTEPALSGPPAPEPHTVAAPQRAWRRLLARGRPLIYHRWLQLPLVAGIAAALVHDRYLLCKQYLFRYTDEDQAIMWYAAHELLNGRIHEPSFFGQDYNSCLEGFLAVPLIAMGMPFNEAVPLVTVVLGLLPFLLVALVAWWRGHSLVSAAALLVPLLMPVRYGIITGIPRGFVTGIAIAALPAILLLPPPLRRRRRHADGAEPAMAVGHRPRHLTRSFAAVRYFLAAALSLVAIQVNPNCLVLLVPVGVYALLTSWREWKFWVFGIAGLIAAAPYLLYVYQFYYLYHPDYPAYLRGVNYEWGYRFYTTFFNSYVVPRNGAASPILMDLVPIPIRGTDAPMFLVAAFSAVGGLLLLRNRSAALLAGMAGVLFTFVTFGYERVLTRNGGNSASFPFGRMYLAIPVLWVWLLFLVNHTPWQKLSDTPAARWMTRGALVGMLAAAIHVAGLKEAQLPGAISAEVSSAVVCPPIPVEQTYATAREVDRVAEAQRAELLVVGGGDKLLAYALPAISSVETLYLPGQNFFERRTWRFIEETTIKRNNVLVLNVPSLGARQVGGGRRVLLDADGEPVDDDETVGPATPAGVQMGGRGVTTAGGRGGQGARGTATGAGGRGPGGRNLSVDRTAANPYTMQQTHMVSIPAIGVVAAGGRPLYDVPMFRPLLPQLIRPRATPENPEPTTQVYRPNWGGR